MKKFVEIFRRLWYDNIVNSISFGIIGARRALSLYCPT